MKVPISTLLRATLFVVASFGAVPCLAASGGFQDKMASFLAVFIIIVVPIGGIALFWLVHVLPEKIAEKRQHPQKDAIHVLCLLSLVFGGLLWPLAWLWAYTKPVMHKLAYGRDKHEDFYEEQGAEESKGAGPVDVRDEIARLRHDLDALAERGATPDAVQKMRERLASIESRTATGAGK